MEYGALTSHIDVAQIVLYAFFVFFVALVWYLRQENRREGFPLRSERRGVVMNAELTGIPSPKAFLLPHGNATRYSPALPSSDAIEPPMHAVPAGNWPGAPLTPVGDPLLSGVGPAAYAMRHDEPEVLWETGEPKIVPMRVSNGFYLTEDDPDPRGMSVIAADGEIAGIVRDVWVDKSETVIRYVEVALSAEAGARIVLVPMTMTTFSLKTKTMKVASINAAQFANAPALKHPTTISSLEEDKICAYFGAGHLYRTPERLGPVL